MIPEFSETLRRKEKTEAQYSSRHWKICGGVFILHTVIITVPLIWMAMDNFFRPPKVNAFRVKIGPKELSHAPLVGPPERTRPKPAGPPIPAEPAVSVPPAPPAEPKVSIPKPKPKIKKAVRKTVKKRAVKRTAKRTKKTVQKKTVKKRNLQNEVYRPPRGTNELRETAGRNFNPNVPIGSRDRGQVQGKADHRTPGGGLTEEMEQYNRRAGMYLKNVWFQPPKSLLGDQLPAVTIELEIASDGRVTAGRILKTSGVAAMDDSVRNLLKQLDRMPAPPKRGTVIQFILQTDD